MNTIKRCKLKQHNIKTACLAIIIASSALLLDNKNNIKRRWWVRPWLNRKEGNINIVDKFIESEDLATVLNFLRMDNDTFNKLLLKVCHRISKYSIYRECISAKHKLLVTLRYLATGESFRSLMYNYRVSESTISLFIPVVCKAIYEELKNDYLKVPSTTTEWLEISEKFYQTWNMPNVIGALDGKHITIKAPKNQGSAFYNYKDMHSIVLLALVDAEYNFIYINVGTNGRISDGGIYMDSDLHKAVQQNLLNLPKDKPLPGRTQKVPHVIVADAAFSLSPYLMKPYPIRGIISQQRIFNYRLSRARRVVENVFGIMANRFRVLINTIPLQPEKARLITQACCVLHNFLRAELKGHYVAANAEGEINENRFIYSLPRDNRRSTKEALGVRQEFAEYFSGCGRVPWQDSIL